MAKNKYKAPQLRFPKFKDGWEPKRLSQLVTRASKPVKVEGDKIYREIGIRSHGKGIFHKDPITGKELGNKRVFWVKENALTVNIVFAWEQAVAKTTEKEAGMIASHRFPMYLPIPNESDIDYLQHFFLTRQGKILLGLASPGGAGRNKTLGQKEFENLKFYVPKWNEQEKIAAFLNAVDLKIDHLKAKKDLLEKYKKGVLQQVFNQEIRFKGHKGKSFSPWESKKLKKYLIERKERNSKNKYSEVFSVAKNNGVINQMEHLGRSYASADLSNYKVVFPGDLVYTKSPTSEFPFGIIKQNKLQRTGVVSVLYGIFIPETELIGELLDIYFSNSINTLNYLTPIVKKGAKNTINIGNKEFLDGAEISLPSSIEEQKKIVEFVKVLDSKIKVTENQFDNTRLFKKGLLQSMFC